MQRIKYFQKGYALTYVYGNERHPNAPSAVLEAGKPKPTTFLYDGNGSMTYQEEFQSFRNFYRNEENQLSGMNINGRIHQYIYDFSGERTLKVSGDSQTVGMNGQTVASLMNTDNYTLYVSPYFVVQKGKFTKHYFQESQRVASKLGTGKFYQPLSITAGGINYTALTASQQRAIDNYVKTLGVPPGPPTQMGIYASPEFTGVGYPVDVLQDVPQNNEPPEGWPRKPYFNPPGDVPGPPAQWGPPITPEIVKPEEGFIGNDVPENDIFFFHPDHLGSTSCLTGKNGEITQNVAYLPFGDVFFEEHNSKFQTKYLFNGKLLDEETNMSYFGARYKLGKFDIWERVDPLLLREEVFNNPEETNGGIFNGQNLSPYAFSYNNPQKYVDPDGECPACWGAIIGAGVDYSLQVALNFYKGKKGLDVFTDVDVKSILVSAGAGAISGGISSINQIKNAKTLTKVGIEIATDTGISVGSQAINNGNVSLESTVTDVVSGQIVGRFAGKIVEKKVLGSKTGRMLEANINREKNIALGKSNKFAKSKANIEGAKKTLDNYVEKRAVTGSTTSSGIFSKMAENLRDNNSKKEEAKKNTK